MIQQPFPAEHPYASHVPRLKLFPSFANTAEETKRGVAALQSQPLTSETPASNYDTLIVHKTKGKSTKNSIYFTIGLVFTIYHLVHSSPVLEFLSFESLFICKTSLLCKL